MLGLVVAGCAMPRVVETARQGDLAALKAEIARAQGAGQLDARAVGELARAVAQREVASTHGDESVERIRQARGCLGAVQTEVLDRAKRHDDAGAAATLLLLDRGKLAKQDLYRRYRSASSGAWRAVAARLASGARRGPARRRYFVDVDERVRRSALRAAFDARESADTEALLEVARLDPDPLSRSLAMRALGNLGGERVVLGLLDLWPRAEQADRLAILEAWEAPAALSSGGRERLVKVAEGDSGLVAVAAAAALARVGWSDRAEGVLVRAVKEGTPAEQELAISAVSVDSDRAVQALRDAARPKEGNVAVRANSRLAEVPAERSEAVRNLRALAAGSDEVARLARTELARLDDRTPIPLLKRDLAARTARDRQAAAIGLLHLGDHSAAATALGDDSGRVRMAVACAVISAP